MTATTERAPRRISLMGVHLDELRIEQQPNGDLIVSIDSYEQGKHAVTLHGESCALLAAFFGGRP